MDATRISRKDLISEAEVPEYLLKKFRPEKADIELKIEAFNNEVDIITQACDDYHKMIKLHDKELTKLLQMKQQPEESEEINFIYHNNEKNKYNSLINDKKNELSAVRKNRGETIYEFNHKWRKKINLYNKEIKRLTKNITGVEPKMEKHWSPFFIEYVNQVGLVDDNTTEHDMKMIQWISKNKGLITEGFWNTLICNQTLSAKVIWTFRKKLDWKFLLREQTPSEFIIVACIDEIRRCYNSQLNESYVSGFPYTKYSFELRDIIMPQVHKNYSDRKALIDEQIKHQGGIL